MTKDTLCPCVGNNMARTIETQAAEIARLTEELAQVKGLLEKAREWNWIDLQEDREAGKEVEIFLPELCRLDSKITDALAQTEQPNLQLSARKVEGDAPDQTEVSSGPSAAPTDNTALVEALDVCLEWIDAVPSDTPLPAMPGFDRDWVDNIRNRAARGSKEGGPTIPDEQRIRQDERTAIAAYIGMSPSEVTDRQYHMEAIRTGLYRDDPLMQRGGRMEGGDG